MDTEDEYLTQQRGFYDLLARQLEAGGYQQQEEEPVVPVQLLLQSEILQGQLDLPNDRKKEQDLIPVVSAALPRLQEGESPPPQDPTPHQLASEGVEGLDLMMVLGEEATPSSFMETGHPPSALASFQPSPGHPHTRSRLQAELYPAEQETRIEGMLQLLEAEGQTNLEPLNKMEQVVAEMAASRRGANIRVTVEEREAIEQERAFKQTSTLLEERRTHLSEWEAKLQKEQQALLKRKNGLYNAEAVLKRAALDFAAEKKEFAQERKTLYSKYRSKSLVTHSNVRAKSEDMLSRERSVSEAQMSNDGERDRLTKKQQALDELASALQEQLVSTRSHFEAKAKRTKDFEQQLNQQRAVIAAQSRVLSQAITRLTSLPQIQESTKGAPDPALVELSQCVREITGVARMLEEHQLSSSL